MESCKKRTCSHAKTSFSEKAHHLWVIDFRTLSPAFQCILFSPLCDVFLFVKGELRRWESRNSIAVNSNTPPSNSSLWHWCGTKVSRVTSQTFTTGHKDIVLLGSRNTGVLCYFVCAPAPNRENKPHLAHEEKFWDSNKCWQKKRIVFSISEISATSSGLWWELLVPSVLNITHVASTFSSKELHWKIDFKLSIRP